MNVNDFKMYKGFDLSEVPAMLVSATIAAYPEQGEAIFKSLENWKVDNSAKAVIINLAQSLPAMANSSYEIREKIEHDALYVNAVTIAQCHHHHATQLAYIVENIPCEWVAVIHEENMVTLYNFLTGAGLVTTQDQQSDILKREDCIRESSFGLDNFEHKIVFAPVVVSSKKV